MVTVPCCKEQDEYRENTIDPIWGEKGDFIRFS
jgi:hypothetical protein